MRIAGEKAERAPEHDRPLVLCHGVFDIVHPGHLAHLKQARAQGKNLVVAIVADAYVRKGAGHPVFNQSQRAEFLAALKVVDWVVVVNSPLAMPALEAIRPDVYCKGPDYGNPDNPFAADFQAEKTFVEAYGGKVVLTTGPTYSSTKLMERLLNADGNYPFVV